MGRRLVEVVLMVVAAVVWSVLLYLTWLLWSTTDVLILLVGLMVLITMGVGFSADSYEREEERRRQERCYYALPN
jgi:predicted neutral ceramidase superfamily lipid hydrolase